MKNLTTIQVFIVFPKRKDKWKYYINDNLKDSHTLHRDKIQQLILQYINSKAGNQVIEHLNKYHAFIVYTKQNKVYRLQVDKESAFKQMKEKFNREAFNADKIYKKIKKEQTKNEDDMFISQNNALLKKILK